MISPLLLQAMSPNGSASSLLNNGRQATGLGKGDSSFAGVLAQMLGNNTSRAVMVSEGSIPSGHALLEKLKKALMASGLPLDQFVANGPALDAFSKLMVSAGFRENDVTAILNELKAKASGQGILASDLFKAASQLSPETMNTARNAQLNISALPYVETIMTKLGVSPEQAQHIISDATGEGNSIDIQKLIRGLKKVQLDMGSDGSGPVDPAASEELLEMMQRVGLTGGSDSPIEALDRLISMLNKNKGASVAADTEADNGTAVAAIVTQLQKISSRLGVTDSTLHQLVKAAKENSPDARAQLISQLAALRDQAAALDRNGVASDNPADLGTVSNRPKTSGTMTLGKFVAALETRLVSDQQTAQTTTGMAMPQGNPQGTKETFNAFIQALTPSQRQMGGKNDTITAGSLSSTAAKQNSSPNQLNQLLSGNKAVISPEQAETAPQMSEKSVLEKDQVLLAAVKSRQHVNVDREVPQPDAVLKEVRTIDTGVEGGAKTASARTLPGYLLDQVSRQIVRLRQTNQSEMTLQLKPPHLGRMKLSIEHTDTGLKVSMIVEQAAAKDMLLSQSNDLKAALMEQGLRLDKMDVETQANFDRSMAQAQQDSGQSGGRGKRRFKEMPETSTENTLSENEQGIAIRNDGLLNLVA